MATNWIALFSVSAIIFTSCAVAEINGTTLKSHHYDSFDFIDYSGREISNLHSNGTGAVVSFLFTQCTDVCPITVHKIKNAINMSEHPEIPVIIFLSLIHI